MKPTDSSPLAPLTAEKISKKFKTRKTETIISEVDLHLEAGDIFCLLGANGSGKTTLLRTLLGIYPPDHGRTLFWGNPMSDDTKRRLGYLEDQAPQFPFLKVREFVDFSLQLFAIPRKQRAELAENALDRVGLIKFQDRPLHALSRGMEKRMGLAALIAHEPDFMILDEPLEGLDFEGLLFFEQHLRDCKKEGKTVLFTTHLYAHVQNLASRVGFIHEGKLIERPIQDIQQMNRFSEWMKTPNRRFDDETKS